MTEQIYNAIQAILFVEFPRDSTNHPIIYDRAVKNWFLGERGVVPDDLSVVVSGKTASESDEFYGYRKVEYDFSVILYASGDDQLVTLKLAAEGTRIIRNILNNHKRMWVMDLCPICGKLPTSPEHYFIDSEHQAIFGVYGTETGPTGAAGTIYNSFRSTWYRTHSFSGTPGNVVQIQITASGANYVSAPAVIITGGGFGASGAAATTAITSGGVSSVTMTSTGMLYTATPSVAFSGSAGVGNSARGTAIVSAPSKAGMAAGAFYKVLTDYQNGVIPSTLTEAQRNRFSNLIRDGVYPIREIFDVQITSVTYTDEFVDKALNSTSTISLRFKELLPVNKFGPNFSGSAYNPQEAI